MGVIPYLHSIVLNPASLGHELLRLHLTRVDGLPSLVEDDCSSAGCSLIDSDYKLFNVALL
jgi:hypothetical protein